jgi:hypothetical protein
MNAGVLLELELKSHQNEFNITQPAVPHCSRYFLQHVLIYILNYPLVNVYITMENHHAIIG